MMSVKQDVVYLLIVRGAITVFRDYSVLLQQLQELWVRPAFMQLHVQMCNG